jgi:hypothetical protein
MRGYNLFDSELTQAVHFLLSHSPGEGVHFAIVLAWYGLLRISSSKSVFEDDLCIPKSMFV